MQLNEAIDRFLGGYFSTCRRSSKTETAYRIDLAQFRDYFPGMELESIGSERLERWAAELGARHLEPTTIRRKFATLRLFFLYWVRKGKLETSPFWKIRLDLARERKLPRNLTALQTQRLIQCAWRRIERSRPEINSSRDSTFLAIRNLAAIEVLFATGMRVGELVALNLEDWNNDDGSFVVRGKGARQRLSLLPDIRSLTAVQRYLTDRRTRELNHNAMFISVSGTRLSTQGVARALSILAREAKIEITLTPHMLRHTVATLLLRQGADIRVVQEILGHSSIAMTERYTHVSKEHLRSTLTAHHPNHRLEIQTVNNQGQLFQ